MRKPRSVYVQATRYKLVFDPDLRETHHAHGMQDWANKVITLDASLTGHTMAEVFIHELGHAVYAAGNLGAARDEEDMVSRCAAMIIELAMNPRNKPAWTWWKHLLDPTA